MSKKLNCGIYEIKNLINGKFYIGQSVNLTGRRYNHLYHLENNIHHSRHLQSAYNKYGKENFDFIILLYCEPEELTYYEQSLVNLLNPEYNVRIDCVDSNFGLKRDDQTIKNMINGQRKRFRGSRPKNYRKIIFDELKEAKHILRNGLSFFISNVDLGILAKYLRHKGKTDLEIKNDLIRFCEKYIKENNIQQYSKKLLSGKIKRAIKDSNKRNLRIPKDIFVTENELNSIKQLELYKAQRVIFLMLVISKYMYFTDSSKNDEDDFLINLSFFNILKIAKINIDKEERKYILDILIKHKFIENVSKYAYKINIIDNYSPIAIVVDKIENAIDFYPFYCEKCGKKLKYKPKRRNICDKCYNLSRKQKGKEYM